MADVGGLHGQRPPVHRFRRDGQGTDQSGDPPNPSGVESEKTRHEELT